MEFEYRLNAENYKTFTVYTLEKNNKGTKLYGNLWITYPIIALGIISYTIQTANINILMCLFISIPLWLFFYPKVSKYLFSKRIEAHIERYCSNDIDLINNISLKDGFIEDKNSNEKHIVNVNMIDKIIELSTMYFIYYDVGKAIILPKVQETSNIIQNLENMVNKKRIIDNNWKL